MIASEELLKSVHALNTHELAWLSGYCWARTQNGAPLAQALGSDATGAVLAPPEAVTTPRQVLVLSGSQTGNARRVAEQLHEQLQGLQAEIRIESIGDYKARQLAEEDIVLLVCSTQGEGEYPEEAISFAKFLFGKRAPDLSQLSFAVLALGDSSYPLFCEAGKNFDLRLAELGATRLFDRIDCDLSYEAQATAWRQDIRVVLHEQLTLRHDTEQASAQTAAVSTAEQAYTKDQPYRASLIAKQKITSRAANKNVQHIEIDLADSGIEYQAGDALGVYVKNNPELVGAFLDTLQLDGSQPVRLANGLTLPLEQALLEHLELTQNQVGFIKKWAEISQHPELLERVAHADSLHDYAANTPILAVIKAYPANVDAQTWVDVLRPLTPRMYSIASAQDEVGPEVHLTLGLVQYEHDGQAFAGVASDYLGLQLDEGDEIDVFVEANPRFRLPADPATPIIMIGSGTGVAPFRSFMQQREADDATGPAWLIFGNQRFTDDFLYQSEWQRWHKQGTLSKTSFAWSRQQPNTKVYVQQRVQENAAELWQWIQQGAHIYVCGDANNMAKAVEAALLELISTQGQLNEEDADAYLDQLRDDRRYQRDVY